jgi:hypothetical protein
MATDRALITLTAGQRMVPLPFSYIPGAGSLFISINGKNLSNVSEYTELSVNSIFLADPAVAGEILEARNIQEVSF